MDGVMLVVSFLGRFRIPSVSDVPECLGDVGVQKVKTIPPAVVLSFSAWPSEYPLVSTL